MRRPPSKSCSKAIQLSLFRVKIPLHQSEVARNTLSVVIGFTGVILAFSLVQAQGNLRNIETQVGAEAHDLAQMDRLLIRYGDPTVDAIRAELHDYANSIVKDEWSQLSNGRSSERTNALFSPISRNIMAMESTSGRESLIYSEVLKKVDELAEDREARLVAASKMMLPLIFWETIFFLLAILLLLATLCETAFAHVVALGLDGFGISLLVSLVFILDQPFKGQLSVSPDPIAKVVAEMQTRTR